MLAASNRDLKTESEAVSTCITVSQLFKSTSLRFANDPAVRIIAASALTARHKAGEASLEGVKAFLSKPYTAEKLLVTLAKVLRD